MGAKTPGVINGTDFLVYIDATHPIGLSTDCSITINRATRDTSNKDSGGWKTVLPGQREWTISCNALMAFDKTYNLTYLNALMIAGTVINIRFQTGNTAGDSYFTGTAYITSVNLSAANQSNATFSISFQGSGALSMTDPMGGTSPTDPGGGIKIVATGDIISGRADLYIANSASAVDITIDHINNVVGKMPVINNGAGNLTITPSDGLLIAGVGDITLTTGQNITIFANDTEFNVIGSWGV